MNISLPMVWVFEDTGADDTYRVEPGGAVGRNSVGLYLAWKLRSSGLVAASVRRLMERFHCLEGPLTTTLAFVLVEPQGWPRPSQQCRQQ